MKLHLRVSTRESSPPMCVFIKRTLERIAKEALNKYPVITITGPRQSGKTTLARHAFRNMPYANLERPDTRSFAIEDPRGFLRQFPSGAVLDEIQRVPDLLSYIQVIVDEHGGTGLFVLTGSRQLDMMSAITQSLAGRTAIMKLLPFSIQEMKGHYPVNSLDDLMCRGFLPRIYDNDIPPAQALGDYIESYIERDLHELIQVRNLSTFQRFMRLCAGRVGRLLNIQSLGNDAGVSHTTAREWLSMLEMSYIIFLLEPFHKNIRKRLVKSPKLYFYGVGLASYLCGIEQPMHVSHHPLRGNLFENLVVMEVMKYRLNRGLISNLQFYRDNTGNEVDLLYQIGDGVLPVEIKSGMTMTSDYFIGLKRFREVVSDQCFGQILVYGGDESMVRDGVTITTIAGVADLLDSYFGKSDARSKK